MKTKKILEIYKSFYLVSVLICMLVLASSVVGDPMPYIIANMLELMDINLFDAVMGGNASDPRDFANL